MIYGLDWGLDPALAQRRNRILGAPALGQSRGQGQIQFICYWYIIGIGISVFYANPFQFI